METSRTRRLPVLAHSCGLLRSIHVSVPFQGLRTSSPVCLLCGPREILNVKVGTFLNWAVALQLSLPSLLSVSRQLVYVKYCLASDHQPSVVFIPLPLAFPFPALSTPIKRTWMMRAWRSRNCAQYSLVIISVTILETLQGRLSPLRRKSNRGAEGLTNLPKMTWFVKVAKLVFQSREQQLGVNF